MVGQNRTEILESLRALKLRHSLCVCVRVCVCKARKSPQLQLLLTTATCHFCLSISAFADSAHKYAAIHSKKDILLDFLLAAKGEILICAASLFVACPICYFSCQHFECLSLATKASFDIASFGANIGFLLS